MIDMIFNSKKKIVHKFMTNERFFLYQHYCCRLKVLCLSLYLKYFNLKCHRVSTMLNSCILKYFINVNTINQLILKFLRKFYTPYL